MINLYIIQHRATLPKDSAQTRQNLLHAHQLFLGFVCEIFLCRFGLGCKVSLVIYFENHVGELKHGVAFDLCKGDDVVQVVDQQMIRHGEAKMLLISAQYTLQRGEQGRIKCYHSSMKVGQHGLQGTLFGYRHCQRGHEVVEAIVHAVRWVVNIVHEVGVQLSHLPNVLPYLVPVANPVAFLFKLLNSGVYI